MDNATRVGLEDGSSLLLVRGSDDLDVAVRVPLQGAFLFYLSLDFLLLHLGGVARSLGLLVVVVSLISLDRKDRFLPKIHRVLLWSCGQHL